METWIRQVVMEYFSTIGDFAFWFQMLCAAVFTFVALDGRGRRSDYIVSSLGKMCFLLIIFTGVNFMMWNLSLYHIGFAGIGSWISYLTGIVLFAVLFCKYQLNAKIVTATAVFSITTVVIELGSTLGNVLEIYIQGFDSVYTKIGADLLLLVAAGVLYRCPVSRYFVSIHTVRLNMVCCILSSVAVIVYDLFSIHVFGRDGGAGLRILMTMFFVFLYVINTISYLMTYSLSKEQTNKLELQAAAQMEQSTAQLLSMSQHNLDELRKINHDIQNQLSYIQVLLNNRQYEELDNYFSEILGTFSEAIVPYIDCGNRVLNAIFNMEDAKAKEYAVTLNFKVAAPRELPFRELDLCNLLTNVVDNAIEACVSEEIKDPVVDITVNPKGDYLFVSVTNPTKKQENFFQRPGGTSKEDKLNHGKGMSIIRQIIGKYNGCYKQRIEDGVFHMEFLLDMYGRNEGEKDHEGQIKNCSL